MRNSPANSVMAPLSMPPPSIVLRSSQPVETFTILTSRSACTSLAVWKPAGRAILYAASRSFSTLASETPLTEPSLRLVMRRRASTVVIPSSLSLRMSLVWMPKLESDVIGVCVGSRPSSSTSARLAL